MRLVASLATRGRPAQLLETLARHMACMSRADTKMIVQCDNDDWATLAALQSAQLDPRVVVNYQAREDTVAAKWNRVLSEPADVYLVSADDDPYMTPELDEKILQAAEHQLPEDRIGLIYGHNANASFPSVIAYTAQWVEVFDGKLQPDYFPYWFADHWTDDVGRIIDRIAFADVRTDQSKVGKTMEMREPGWWATWFDAAYLFRRHQAHHIINSPKFHAPHWLKRKCLAHHPMVEFRSRWINDTVRQQSPQLNAMFGTINDVYSERYIRIKNRAIAMLPKLLEGYGMDIAEAMRFREMLDPPNVVPSLPKAYA